MSAAHAVPAGDDVAVLRPGEHPGDGAQIAQRPRAESARRARADIEQRDLLERARRLEILDEAGMGDEAGIGGARGAGQRLQDVVELALRLQRLLALGFQRMLEHARGEQLHLIERGTLIGIFIGDHLALLGDAEAPADRAGGLGGDGAARRRAAAGDRAAAPMEEGDGHAGLGADACQLRLRLGQLPVRGDEAAVLVGIGIADHHLLHVALPMGAAADERHRQRLAHDVGRGAEIVDGLEQRHDGKGADLRCRPHRERRRPPWPADRRRECRRPSGSSRG